ncbi:MAG: aminotransferase class IV, partial [Planctomycetes bacterium]|nr:aminotransferase class IV [Planctomycetota bacterium]
LIAISKKARVFVSMPYIEGLTPRYLSDMEKCTVFPTDEVVERREGYFAMDEASLSSLDHGGLYGDACFEGILITNGRIFVLKEHVLRWLGSARKLKIKVPYTAEQLADRILKTVQQVKFKEGETGYLRPVITRGVGNLGIHPYKCVAPTLYIICSTIRLYPAEAYETGIELAIARQTRRPGKAIIDPNIKSNNYLNNISALLETLDQGKLETLMITAHGNVAEATADNLFLIEKDEGWESDPSKVRITTPDPAFSLRGITRFLIMEEAKKMGYQISESRHILPIDLVGPGKECFMTGTGCGLMPVVGIKGNLVGTGKPGPVTNKLLAAIRALMENPAYGLSIDADDQAVIDYMAKPCLYDR